MIKKLTITTMITGMFFFTGCGGLEDLIKDKYTATVQIDNTTTYDVNELYIKKSSSSAWGRDLIAPGKVVKANSKVNFETLLCDTLIDIKVEYDFSLDSGIKEQVRLDCGDEYRLKLVN